MRVIDQPQHYLEQATCNVVVGFLGTFDQDNDVDDDDDGGRAAPICGLDRCCRYNDR